MFGENLDLVAADVSGALLGEQWRAGDVLMEVTAPRMACGTFGAWMGEKGWAKRFNAARRPGAYLRVLEEGRLAPGDRLEVVWQPPVPVSVAESVGAILGDRDVLRRIGTLSDRVPGWNPEAMMFHVARRAKSGARQGNPATCQCGEKIRA